MPSRRNKTNSLALQANMKQNIAAAVARQVNRSLSGAKKKKSRRKGASPSNRGVLSPYAAMLNDPCNAPLVPGMFGTSEGYLQRFHMVQSLEAKAPAPATCGFLLWAPEFHNPGLANAAAPAKEAILNFLFGSALTATDKINLSGLSTSGTYGTQAFRDPASDFGRSALVASARTVSACLKLTYTGSISNCRGLVAKVEIPFSVFSAYLLPGANTGNTVGISVDQLFAMSTDVRRQSLDPMESKYLPRPDAKFLTGFGGPNGESGLPTWPDGQRDTDVLYEAVSALGTGEDTFFEPGEYAKVNDPTIIGFAWKGMGTNAADDFQCDVYKNIEWKPDASQAIPQVPRVTTHTIPPVVSAAMALDKIDPDWKTSMVAHAKSAGTRLSEQALAQAGRVVTKVGKRAIGKVEGLMSEALWGAFAI